MQSGLADDVRAINHSDVSHDEAVLRLSTVSKSASRSGEELGPAMAGGSRSDRRRNLGDAGGAVVLGSVQA